LFLSIIVIAATLAVTTICYAQFEPNAYEVSVNGKVIAYIRNSESNLNLVGSLNLKLKERFNNSNIEQLIEFKSTQVPEDYFSDEKLLEQAIAKNSNLEVEAVCMYSDNKEIGILASEKEGQQVLDKVKEYYEAASKMQVKESKIKSPITYTKKKLPLSQVENVEKVFERIKEVNAKAKAPVVVIELKANLESKETIKPNTTTKSTNTMKVGTSVVQSQGKEGQKVVVKELTLENNKVKSTKVLSEKTVVKPENKVVLKGTKSTIEATKATFATPSRGSVSSAFGERWGRMHEGLDIAANLGSPIYAALSGTVSFAGWSDGYGKLIKLKHDNGLETYYGHCSKLLVSTGEKVDKGDKIGEVGSTGRSTGPHLHFEVRVNGVAKNPTNYLK
jgi:murein DD-endopeptidase MepM/ murein hydrolase activator NlpD